jgi:hypothetical protein
MKPFEEFRLNLRKGKAKFITFALVGGLLGAGISYAYAAFGST